MVSITALWFAGIVACILTPLVAIVMRRCKIMDNPKRKSRKIHRQPIPLGGGLVIFLTFFGLLFLATVLKIVVFPAVLQSQLYAIFFGALILVAGGLWDDARELSPRYQIIFPISASLIAVVAGIAPQFVTNPLGGVLAVNTIIPLAIGGLQGANILLFFWLMGMMFTTKFLDGLDGLVTGMVGIGAIIILLLTQQAAWWQPEVGFLAQLLAGACFGFLVWNFHPAKIFLGEGGSLVTGYLLAVIAVISGSKIITTLLVMGVPALDVARVILHRITKGKPVFVGDSEHLHFKMLESGLTQRQAVSIFYGIGFVFGISALFLNNTFKLIAFLTIAVVLLCLTWFLARHKKTNV